MANLDYSGIVIDQNVAPESPLDLITTGVYQTFQLPTDFVRGTITPTISGAQLFVTVDPGMAAQTSVTWRLDVLTATTPAPPSNPSTGRSGTLGASVLSDFVLAGGSSPSFISPPAVVSPWIGLATGTSTGTALDGQTWFTIDFGSAITVEPQWLTASFRLVITAMSSLAIAYTVPNPLVGQAFTLADTPITDTARSVSLMFRLLADVADVGVDFLGNLYRSAAVSTLPGNILPVATNDETAFWLSPPSPSYFGVESLYFDVRDRGAAVVVDRLTLDPLTPNMYFTVYWSNDPTGPGTDTTSWESLLWTPIYITWQAKRADTYAFPSPVTAQYLKVEFTSLQARPYDPGNFQLPVTFKKYPKWVLDYFLAKFAVEDHDLFSSGVDVTYDALDLAFTYYQGDLVQAPAAPALSSDLTAPQARFFQAENAADQIDAQTLNLIRFAFQPFLSQPALLGRLTTILGRYASSVATSNYSTEIITTAIGDTTVVSNLKREPLLLEKGFPVMSFFIPCRHGYRISQASFEQNLAYFAGVKSLVFHRDLYTFPADQLQFNETLGDGANLLRNDWLQPLAVLP